MESQLNEIINLYQSEIISAYELLILITRIKITDANKKTIRLISRPSKYNIKPKEKIIVQKTIEQKQPDLKINFN